MNGFQFCHTKTKIMHFCDMPGLRAPPDIHVNQQVIPYETSAKFLGVIFDEKLSFKEHIGLLKGKCLKGLNRLKSLAGRDCGAVQGMLLRLYRALMRSRLDYASIVYGAAQGNVAEIDRIQNDALRIASSVFKSSPTASIYVIANEKLLKLRRELLTLKYFCKTKAHLQNAAYPVTVRAEQKLLYQHKQ